MYILKAFLIQKDNIRDILLNMAQFCNIQTLAPHQLTWSCNTHSFSLLWADRQLDSTTGLTF